MAESKYYKPLCKWLQKKKHYYCGGTAEYIRGQGRIRWYINTGSAKQKVDVAGIKNVGSRHFDQVETIAVEVRDVKKITVRDLQDAHGYSNMAHRCYLATTAEPAQTDMDQATRLGVGLIRIYRTNKFLEIVEAKYGEPNKADMIEFLSNLWIAKCTICQCYSFRWDYMEDLAGKSYFKLQRARQFDIEISGGSAFIELDSGKMKQSTPNSITRYVCRSCIADITIKFPKWAKMISPKKKQRDARQNFRS